MPTFIDLTGQRFGKLVVLSRGINKRYPAGGNQITWICLCDCGGYSEVQARNLRRGDTTSCGCLSCLTPGPELVGRQFGRLTVVDKRKDRRGKTVWLCRCECGNSIISQASVLLRGKTVACGCFQTERAREIGKKNAADLIGLSFGLLTVIAKHNTTKTLGVLWKCLCVCGRTVIVNTGRLRYGCTTSCGRHKGGDETRTSVASRSNSQRRRAAVRQADGTFTAEEIKVLLEKQQFRCANPGCTTPRRSIRKNYRIDHRQPLIPRIMGSPPGSNHIANIQLLCGPCNQRKHNKEPIAWAQEQGYLL